MFLGPRYREEFIIEAKIRGDGPFPVAICVILQPYLLNVVRV